MRSCTGEGLPAARLTPGRRGLLLYPAGAGVSLAKEGPRFHPYLPTLATGELRQASLLLGLPGEAHTKVSVDGRYVSVALFTRSYDWVPGLGQR